MLNRVPTDYALIAPERLINFVTEVFTTSGMEEKKAVQLAGILVTNDMRGVFSHGSQQCANYSHHFRHGQLDPGAEVTKVRESPTTLVLDGGGGLGYFPCLQAVESLVTKARNCGIAVATTTNHGHFGAAGIYARIPLPEGMLCYVTSGHQLNLTSESFVMAAAGGSPMAFGIPCREEPHFLLDFGAVHDMYLGPEDMRRIVEMVPSTVLRSFGLGCACQALGGLLCGVPLDAERAKRTWPGANQGSLMIVIDIKAIADLDDFLDEMDEYSRRVRATIPLPGIDSACLPGTVEERLLQRSRQHGIPYGERHAAVLSSLAEELGMRAP